MGTGTGTAEEHMGGDFFPRPRLDSSTTSHYSGPRNPEDARKTGGENQAEKRFPVDQSVRTLEVRLSVLEQVCGVREQARASAPGRVRRA